MTNRYDFITALTKEAGEKVLASRDSHLSVSAKGDDPRNLVTNVDIEANAFITERIQAAFPGEAIRSEETADTVDASGSYWSIDPIDGTSNFAHALPHYAVVISWMEQGEPTMGAIYNPVTRELFSFEKGKGSFLNGKPITVSNATTIKGAYILLNIGRKEEGRQWGLNLYETFVFIAKAQKCINFAGSALDLAFLAAGRVDVVIYGTMTTMDIACATAMVRASGGEVYSLDGTPVQLSSKPQQIIATSTKALFNEIAQI